MADRATGPVKPPVIDLTARTQRPEAEPRPPQPELPQKPPSLSARDWQLLVGVAVAGAVLGTLLTYVVATGLPLPSRPQALPPDLRPELTSQASRLGQLESSLATLSASAGKMQSSLDATTAKLASDFDAVNKDIAGVKAAIPATPAPVDLTPLETEIKTLKSEVDAIAAGASGNDASTIAQSLSTLETNLESVATRLNGADSTLSALRSDLDATRKALTDHISSALPNEVGPALKLPLLLSGLESAFANGKPFDSELGALSGVLPDLSVPSDLQAAATAGLSRPDALMQRFEDNLPEILAARGPAGGDWVSNATDWLKSLLALRPAEEQAGDSPEAIVSRVEGAMSRRDYAAALALLGQLPQPMQEAARPITADITLHAEADKLVADLRARALSAAESAK
jgi:hypothetical protein